MSKRYLLPLLCCYFSMTYGQMAISDIQSVFVYSATKYLEWPPDDTSEFTITVVGDDDVYTSFIKISKNRKVGSKTIAVRKISSLAELQKSNIVFLGSSGQQLLEKALSQTQGQATLIITSKEGFINKGSDLNLTIKGEKMVFQIREETIQSKGIKVANAFLSLAEKRI